MKKKLLALGLTFAMVFSMAACGGDDGGDASAKTSIVIYDGEWYGLDTYQLSSTAGAQSLNSSSAFPMGSGNQYSRRQCMYKLASQ